MRPLVGQLRKFYGVGTVRITDYWARKFVRTGKRIGLSLVQCVNLEFPELMHRLAAQDLPLGANAGRGNRVAVRCARGGS